MKSKAVTPRGGERCAQEWPVRLDRVFGCWIWQGPKDKDGYGKRGTELAHRVVYEAEVGPIPDGMELDHCCRVRACVRPIHMETVTHRENTRRRRWSRRAQRRECPESHDLYLHGRRTVYGGIICRICSGV